MSLMFSTLLLACCAIAINAEQKFKQNEGTLDSLKDDLSAAASSAHSTFSQARSFGKTNGVGAEASASAEASSYATLINEPKRNARSSSLTYLPSPDFLNLDSKTIEAMAAAKAEASSTEEFSGSGLGLGRQGYFSGYPPSRSLGNQKFFGNADASATATTGSNTFINDQGSTLHSQRYLGGAEARAAAKVGCDTLTYDEGSSLGSQRSFGDANAMATANTAALNAIPYGGYGTVLNGNGYFGGVDGTAAASAGAYADAASGASFGGLGYKNLRLPNGVLGSDYQGLGWSPINDKTKYPNFSPLSNYNQNNFGTADLQAMLGSGMTSNSWRPASNWPVEFNTGSLYNQPSYSDKLHSSFMPGATNNQPFDFLNNDGVLSTSTLGGFGSSHLLSGGSQEVFRKEDKSSSMSSDSSSSTTIIKQPGQFSTSLGSGGLAGTYPGISSGVSGVWGGAGNTFDTSHFGNLGMGTAMHNYEIDSGFSRLNNGWGALGRSDKSEGFSSIDGDVNESASAEATASASATATIDKTSGIKRSIEATSMALARSNSNRASATASAQAQV